MLLASCRLNNKSAGTAYEQKRYSFQRLCRRQSTGLAIRDLEIQKRIKATMIVLRREREWKRENNILADRACRRAESSRYRPNLTLQKKRVTYASKMNAAASAVLENPWCFGNGESRPQAQASRDQNRSMWCVPTPTSMRPLATGRLKPTLPFIPGHEPFGLVNRRPVGRETL